jgi:hypothetical protein
MYYGAVMKNAFLIILLFLLGTQLTIASDVVGIFEPFQIKIHKRLIKKLGVEETTALYHEYIEAKEITDNCTELIGSCDYYLCQEKKNKCGAKGYFLNFAYQYCSDSLKRLAFEVSPKGEEWLNTTAVCLQKEIEAMDVEGKSCKEIKRAAIKGHDKCYSEARFCSLSFSEIKKIFKMIAPSLTTRGVIAEGVQVLKHCVSR